MGITLPAGTYFLGDPCYAIKDEFWKELLDSTDCFAEPIGCVNGKDVVAFGTAYGDGIYEDQYGHQFPVDAGLIGLVPIDSISPGVWIVDLKTLGIFVHFNDPVCCSRTREGVLTFGQHIIDTDPSYEDEYTEEDED